jgi:hypothetical protein
VKRHWLGPWAPVWFLAACHGARSDRVVPGDASTTGPRPPSLSSLTGAGPHSARASQAPCRVIAADGDVRLDVTEYPSSPAPGAAVTAREVLPPGNGWLLLGNGTRLVVKDPRTSRESTFFGSGRVQPCVDHREESWLAAGRFESSEGGGETPGAEEWIVTPLCVLRYVAARLNVDVGPNGTTAAIASGTGFLWTTDDARVESSPPTAGSVDTSEEPWQRWTVGHLRIVPASSRSPLASARAAADWCSVKAAGARALGRALLDRIGESAKPGEGAAEQVRARRIARASCAIARLRLQTLPSSDDVKSLTEMIAAADAAWSEVPVR